MIGQVFLPPEAAERSAVLQANEERQARRDQEDAKGTGCNKRPACNGRIESPRKGFLLHISSLYLLYSFLRFGK